MAKSQLMRVDVPALLDRLDEVVTPPEGARPRNGAWLVDRSWRLRVLVLPDHRYCGNDVWKPGISIDCCDRQGRFGTDSFVEFEECRLTRHQIDRMFRFIDRWDRRGLQREEQRRRARWPRKNQDIRIDALPTHRSEWEQQPAAVEQAYRRGFAQGAGQAFEAVREGAALTAIEKWIRGPLWCWRQRQRDVILRREKSADLIRHRTT